VQIEHNIWMEITRGWSTINHAAVWNAITLIRPWLIGFEPASI